MRSLDDLFQTWFNTYFTNAPIRRLDTNEAHTAFMAGAASMADLFASGQGLKVTTENNVMSAVHACGALNRIIVDSERFLEQGAGNYIAEQFINNVIEIAKQGLPSK
jgi:hypothetical protein